jgi:hypothetical protein
MAMVLATWADPNVTPKTECAWALNHKPSFKALGQGTYYSYFEPAAKRYGLECRQITPGYIYGNANSPYHEQAKKALDNGDFVIACMGKGTWTSSGHYVLVWGVEGNTVYINDPASTKLIRTRGDYATFKKQVKHYWIIKRPKSHSLSGPDAYEDIDYAVRVTDRTGLNCREGPGISHKVIKVYPYNSEFRVSKSTRSGWAKTDIGWVNLTNTERVKDLTRQETEKLIAEKLEKNNAVLLDSIKQMLPRVYEDEKEIPSWYQKSYAEIRSAVKGTGTSLGLSEDILKVFTIMDRLVESDKTNSEN